MMSYLASNNRRRPPHGTQVSRPRHLAGLPLHAHILDDLQAHRVATDLGKPISQGVLEWSDVLALLFEFVSKRGYDADAMHARLVWTLRDSVVHWHYLQQRAERDISRVAVSLMERRRPVEELIAAGHHANEHLSSPLLTYEVREVLERKAAWFTRDHSKVRRRVW